MGTRLLTIPKLTIPKLTLPDVGLAAIGLLSLVCAFVLPPTRGATPALSALGVLSLWVIREQLRRDRAREDAMKERGPWISAAEALRRIHKEEADLWGRAGFPCGSFEFPLIACPRAEFADSLARHEDIVRRHASALLFLARKDESSTLLHPLDDIESCAGQIDARCARQPTRVSVHHRLELARRFHDFLVVEQRLLHGLGPGCMLVVVVDDDIVSVWKLDLRTVMLDRGGVRRELVLERDVVAFEPIKHHVERNGSAYIRWWRASATAPMHEERFELRPAAATEEEYLDRLFSVAEPELRQVAAIEQARAGGVQQLLLIACSRSEHGGAIAMAYSGGRSWWIDEVAMYPKLKAVIDRPWPLGWVPVLVGNKSFSGIRWVAVRDDAAPEARPGAATDFRTWSTRRSVGRA
jgi:hypothetical protein